jgi:CheY-like chemotaxis protein
MVDDVTTNDLVDDLSKDYTTELTSEETEDDIFKPVQSISQELLSKIENEKHLVDDLARQEVKTSEILDKNKSDEFSNNQFNEQESDVQESLSEAIKDELASDTDNIPEINPPQALDLTKLNCLYIEDQVDSQILFKVQMKELHDVKFAVSFEEAQLVLLNYQFDFIVMDINLQGEYNGLDALKIIKTMPAFSSIPIIAVTAYVLPGDKEKFIAAGFDDFISKPIFKEKMMETLEKIFLTKY